MVLGLYTQSYPFATLSMNRLYWLAEILMAMPGEEKAKIVDAVLEAVQD